MKNIVILGAGTGGALVANLLSHRLDLAEWTITVIDRADLHIYQPGLLFLPFGMYGYREQEDVVKPIAEPLPRGVAFVATEVYLIDHARQRGAHRGRNNIPLRFPRLRDGLPYRARGDRGHGAAMGRGVHTFYTLDGALAMREAMADMREGRLVIDICEMPIKCPVAPLEFAFLADYYFREKGIRDRIEISLVTPYTGAFTKPNANRILSKVADEKGIRVVPNFATSAVDAEKRLIRTFDGRTVDYDLLCAIPPNLGPAVIDGSDLGDGAGYALTDPRTLKSRKAERIYLLGDNTNVATSKAGSTAHFEAETVVENLLREIDGKPPLSTFDGHANCFVETGHHKAMLLDFNYDIEPLEGYVPVAVRGSVFAARRKPLEPPGQAGVQVGVLEHAAAGAPAERPAATRAHELPGQGHQYGAPDPRGAGHARARRDDQGGRDRSPRHRAAGGRGADGREEGERASRCSTPRTDWSGS